MRRRIRSRPIAGSVGPDIVDYTDYTELLSDALDALYAVICGVD